MKVVHVPPIDKEASGLIDKKISILVFNKFFLPGYKAGGPIRTIANMIDRMRGEYDFKVVTLDRDAGDSKDYPGVVRNGWNSLTNCEVRYLSEGEISLSILKDIVRKAKPDVIYLNSFFDPTFTQKVLLLKKLRMISNIPIVLAPRGEFSEGALGLKNRKKAVFISIAKFFGLYRGLSWQASSRYEKEDIMRVFPSLGDNDIHVAINLAPANNVGVVSNRSAKKPGELKLVFLSRLSPKKNLDYALKLLSSVEANVEFTIYGPKEVPDYWNECEKIIAELPENIRVSWGGELTPDEIHPVLVQHHLFFFPTRGENYGHVIHEALSAGLPVLISDQTPWHDLEENGVGWSVSLASPEKFVQVIDLVASWDTGQLMKASRAAQKYASEKASDKDALEANIEMFRKQVLGRSNDFCR